MEIHGLCLTLFKGSEIPYIHSLHQIMSSLPPIFTLPYSPFHIRRKRPEHPSCSGREATWSVDIPSLPIEELGPLRRDKTLRKGGSSCCVLRAIYLGQEVAVKLIYNSRDGYADACHEACMYQVCWPS